MSARDTLVEQAPNILTFLGVVLIVADGPLPITDGLGWALIAYGSALRTSYKVADVAVWIEARMPNDSEQTSPADLVYPQVASQTAPTSPTFRSSRNGLRWCNRHRRYDSCYKY